jgi:ABC-2 type transport system permease protein
MRSTLVIFKKELKGFFTGPQLYMVAFLCAVVFSWVYPIQLNVFQETLQNAMYAQGAPQQQFNIHYGVFLRQLSYLNLMLIFVVPALTMRLFAEERKMRTFDLLLTSPVTSAEIVIGKYLAALVAIAAIIFLALLYPIVTVFFVKINWAPLVIAFLGLFMVGAVYAAMNIFCSSLTESAIISFVMAVVFNVSVWFIGIGVEVVDSSLARQIFEHISLNQHLAGMVEGTLRTNSIIFIFSIVAIFVFLSERVVESLRWR